MKGKHRAAGKASVLFLSFSVLVLMAFTTAHAATLTESFTTSTPISSSTPTDWSNYLSFAQFNPALGTLTSVELDLSASMGTYITVENFGAAPSSGTASTQIAVHVEDPGNYLASATQMTYYSAGFGFSGLTQYNTAASGLLTGTGTSSNVYTLAGLLAEFTGAGAISLTASTNTSTNLNYTGGFAAANQATNAGLTGDVVYTYNAPVPLPSALILMGPGLFGLVGLRRRFKS
jgi:hypothetical protein